MVALLEQAVQHLTSGVVGIGDKVEGNTDSQDIEQAEHLVEQGTLVAIGPYGPTQNGSISFNPFSASKNCTRTSLATRSRKFYSTGSIWATIRKTIPRRNSTNLTASQSDGSPTISETQTPQKHERELVTLENKLCRRSANIP